MSDIDIEQKIGSLIVAGGIIGGLGDEARSAIIRDAIVQGCIGGVYLGYPHFNHPADARQTVDDLTKVAMHKLLVAADFEAGPGFNCAAGCAHFPYFGGLGMIDDEETAARSGEITGRQALGMGINWLFSPCLDVNLCPENPIIGIRSFGNTPDQVTRLGLAYLRGCRTSGVLCTVKHFPGTGNTRVDSHTAYAKDCGDFVTWQSQTLPPFATAINNGAEAIMTGHVTMPFLDASGTCATFSEPILQGVLREQLGFTGVVISDSLNMAGAMGNESGAERCVNAFVAGCDMLLTAYDPEIIPAFIRALDDGRIDEARLTASVQRVAAFRGLISEPLEDVDWEGGNTFALKVGAQAVRVLKGEDLLPLSSGDVAILTQWRNDESEYFPREAGVLSALQQQLRRFAAEAPVVAISRDCSVSEGDEVLSRVGDKRTVVFGTVLKNYAGDPYCGTLSPNTLELLQRLNSAGKQVVLIALGSPYAAGNLPGTAVVVCTGGDTMGSVDGVIQRVCAS